MAYTGIIALICGGLLLIARVFRLGFLGDFLSASVLIGFLTGVGVQVFSGQIPDMLGIPKGSGTWFQQQWHTITNVGSTSLPTLAFALATLAIILAFKKWLPVVPGAIVAVVLTIIVSALTQASTHGVAVIGSIQGGFPPIGIPQGFDLSNMGVVTAIAFSCFILIIAQSAATSRSFAMKHGEKVDINRDIVGLAGASFAAGLSGTFVVNGSPTKTQILDEQKGRTQLANMTMSLVVLLVVMFFTSLLADMPKSVLAAIVFLIGIDLIDIAGLKKVWRRRRSEAIVAIITAVVVCAVGVEQGIILAIVASLVDLIRRQYKPDDFVVGLNKNNNPTYEIAKPGAQSEPGLIVFRYDADLFYANANRFVDDVTALVNSAPDPVRWLVLDMSAIDDIDYSAGISLGGLMDLLDAKKVTFAMAGADTNLVTTLHDYELYQRIGDAHMFGTIGDAVRAFQSSTSSA